MDVGIGVKADAAVTGNIVENAPTAGIALGWDRYLRDVSVTGNVVRKADVGITVSVSQGAGSALIDDNLIADAARGRHHRHGSPQAGDRRSRNGRRRPLRQSRGDRKSHQLTSHLSHL